MMTVEGCQHLKIGVVTAEFNSLITNALRDGALCALLEAGVAEDNLVSVSVPGAIELPVAAQWLASTCDAVVALGCVIQGDTDHYDYVCQSVTGGLGRVSLDTGKPVLMGVLTVQTLEQALQRVGGKGGNKGAEAAHGALTMAMLRRRLLG
jgi:6,7-dimethyl-8-ribityllumazine synthase